MNGSNGDTGKVWTHVFSNTAAQYYIKNIIACVIWSTDTLALRFSSSEVSALAASAAQPPFRIKDVGI
jgi:hypothetical protein